MEYEDFRSLTIKLMNDKHYKDMNNKEIEEYCGIGNGALALIVKGKTVGSWITCVKLGEPLGLKMHIAASTLSPKEALKRRSKRLKEMSKKGVRPYKKSSKAPTEFNDDYSDAIDAAEIDATDISSHSGIGDP